MSRAKTILKEIEILRGKVENPDFAPVSIDRKNKKIIVETEFLEQEDIDEIYYMIQKYSTKRHRKIKHKLRIKLSKLSMDLLSIYNADI